MLNFTRAAASLLMLGCMLFGSGCDHRAKAPAAESVEPRPRIRPPSATEIFHLQSECVELGKKVLDANLAYQMDQDDFKNGRAPRYDVTQLAHYNAKDNRCYVELTARNTGIDERKQEQLVREVYDGQTGELLASCTTKNPPLGQRSGYIFKFERVPASALPAPLPFSKGHEEDWSKNEADRTEAYINYLMENNSP